VATPRRPDRAGRRLRPLACPLPARIPQAGGSDAGADKTAQISGHGPLTTVVDTASAATWAGQNAAVTHWRRENSSVWSA
jgi:hypothetical protein